jgi:rhodanese-related sulfurtransferase
VVILDVRPEDEYGLGHLPGALNVPLRQLEQRLLPIEVAARRSCTRRDVEG